MAKFTKLNIGDSVASGGGRAWKKLSAKVALPEWNGIDLTGTTWYVPSGWSATSGYGKFIITGQLQVDGEEHLLDGYFCIGYSLSSSMRYTAKANCFAFGESAMGWGGGTNAQALTLTIDGGADATNSKLITWLKANGSLTSHVMPTITFTIAGTTYQAKDGMTWYEWCHSNYNTYGYSTLNESGAYVVHNIGAQDEHVCKSASGGFSNCVVGNGVIEANATYYHYVQTGGAGN